MSFSESLATCGAEIGHTQRAFWGPVVFSSWVRVMGISRELRNDAVECLRLASQVKERRHKALLMDLARAWICIAEHVEQMRASHSQSRTQARKSYR
jgi:hypothetical protein